MIIDGKKEAEIIRNEIKKEISDLKKKSGTLQRIEKHLFVMSL